MVKRILLILTALLTLSSAVAAPIDTMTGALNERIRSLQVRVPGNPMAPPVIVLNSPDQILISFDHLAYDREYLRYELIHCNANWQPSQLIDLEYLDGFNMGTIEDYAFSRNTTVDYVHYELTIPNEQVAPKVSGNYLLRIYPENDPEDTWLQCRFMVSEQSAAISAGLTSRTDIDYNSAHQQLALQVDTKHSGVEDAFNDVTVMIQQNGRYDNEVSLRHPLRMAERNVAVYEHQPELIFEAGNEYRRMECISAYDPNMGVESIQYFDPYYHFNVYTDAPRTEDMYLYDQTQHGRFFIRQYNSADSDTEADYVVVHFTLDMPQMKDTMIFLDGDFTNRRFDSESLMTYNHATGRYERAMLLKQGAYNYQYLAVPRGDRRGHTSTVEGDKYQTNNEYLIKVYTRRPLDRYDRLIGVTVLQ